MRIPAIAGPKNIQLGHPNWGRKNFLTPTIIRNAAVSSSIAILNTLFLFMGAMLSHTSRGVRRTTFRSGDACLRHSRKVGFSETKNGGLPHPAASHPPGLLARSQETKYDSLKVMGEL